MHRRRRSIASRTATPICRAIIRRPTWSIASSRSGFAGSSPARPNRILLGWTLDGIAAEVVSRGRPSRRPTPCRGDVCPGARRGARPWGLVVRVRTAHGSTRAIEVNVGARYGTNQRVTHLRCHLTDVTDKVRAERAAPAANPRADAGQRAVAADQPRAGGAEGSLQRPVRELRRPCTSASTSKAT